MTLPETIKRRSLTSLRDKRVKIGARVVAHVGYVTSRWRKSPCRANCLGRFCGRPMDSDHDRSRPKSAACAMHLKQGRSMSECQENRAKITAPLRSEPARRQPRIHRPGFCDPEKNHSYPAPTRTRGMPVDNQSSDHAACNEAQSDACYCSRKAFAQFSDLIRIFMRKFNDLIVLAKQDCIRCIWRVLIPFLLAHIR
jgi:hypothetical protein